jgi:hypothetical protein
MNIFNFFKRNSSFEIGEYVRLDKGKSSDQLVKLTEIYDGGKVCYIEGHYWSGTVDMKRISKEV